MFGFWLVLFYKNTKYFPTYGFKINISLKAFNSDLLPLLVTMRTFFRNSISVCLALLVLFSTMSITINQHYCGDTLVDSSLFTKAKTCGMEIENPIGNRDLADMKKDCCKDIVKLIEGQDDLKLDFSNLDLQQQVFITSFVYACINLFESIEKENIHFKDYSPPLIVKDIQILDEVFII